MLVKKEQVYIKDSINFLVPVVCKLRCMCNNQTITNNYVSTSITLSMYKSNSEITSSVLKICFSFNPTLLPTQEGL